MDANNMPNLPQLAAKSLLSSLNGEIRDILLQQLIDEKPYSFKEELFESLGVKLYGGVRMRNEYTYAIFHVCNDGINVIAQSDFICSLYNALDNNAVIIMGVQILFVCGNDDNNDNPNYVNFNCARVSAGMPIVDTNATTDRKILSQDYQDVLVEHPEARIIYNILKDKKIDERHAIANSIVVRFSQSFIFTNNDFTTSAQRHFIVGLDRGYDHRDIDPINSFHQELIQLDYCPCIEYPSHTTAGDREFSIIVGEKKCYVLHRIISCDSGE
jgi:hypothetical protein